MTSSYVPYQRACPEVGVLHRSVSLALNVFHYMIMLTLTFVIILHHFKMVPCINTCDVNKTINAYVDICYYFASL